MSGYRGKHAARVGDLTLATGTQSGAIREGSHNVRINSAAAARRTDFGTVFGGPNTQLDGGAPCVLVNGRQAHRVQDAVRCGNVSGATVLGSPNVLIGDWRGPEKHVWTWIQIELKDGDGKPMCGEVYAVKLPNGTVRLGRFDKDGRGRVEWTRDDPAKCRVWFPELTSGNVRKV